MDAVFTAHAQLARKGNLSKAVDHVQALIDQLQATRDAVASDPDSTPLHMAKLKTPVKNSFDKIDEDLKEVNRGLNQYQKTLNNQFKNAVLPTAPSEGFSDPEQADQVNRAVAMHLLREGMFETVCTMVSEIEESQLRDTGSLAHSEWLSHFTNPGDWNDEDWGATLHDRGHLQYHFVEMYRILDCIKRLHKLDPAIEWARQHREALEGRSSLEFELARLKFVQLYHDGPGHWNEDLDPEDPNAEFNGPIRALEFARETFPSFSARYPRETSQLLGALAFSTDLEMSVYKDLFYNSTAWDDVAATFMRDFCGTKGMVSQSPLYTAVTAGGIALPVLGKYERILAQTRGQWTSVNELPVETPLPPAMQSHSIFVCPVSKEQATDANPPMLLPCGHVIAKESLEMHSRGKQRAKCPYCPSDYLARDAKRLYI